MLSTLIIDKERSARKENTCCMKVYQALVYFWQQIIGHNKYLPAESQHLPAVFLLCKSFPVSEDQRFGMLEFLYRASLYDQTSILQPKNMSKLIVNESSGFYFLWQRIRVVINTFCIYVLYHTDRKKTEVRIWSKVCFCNYQCVSAPAWQIVRPMLLATPVILPALYTVVVTHSDANLSKLTITICKLVVMAFWRIFCQSLKSSPSNSNAEWRTMELFKQPRPFGTPRQIICYCWDKSLG